MNLSPTDAFYLSRVVLQQPEQYPYADLKANPFLKAMVAGGILTNADSVMRVLGNDALMAVLAQDPATPPEMPQDDEGAVFVPPLPDYAQLSDEAQEAAQVVAPWLSEFMNWATARSPMTPPQFLESGALYALGLAVARRCYVHLHEPIYPHLYVLWVAPSGVYRKSTGLACVADLVRESMKHMLLPEEMTPESFMHALAGQTPENYSSLPQHQQEAVNYGRLFAGQRGIIVDEASSLLGASRRDYLQGMTELLLLLYDAKPERTRLLKSGQYTVYNGALSIIGATTPAAMIRTVKDDSWGDGMMARMVLLAPDERLPYDAGNLTPDEYEPPEALVSPVHKLHKMLPTPPPPEEATSYLPAISAGMSKAAHAAYSAYAKAVTHDMLDGPHAPDPRIAPNYVRMHVQAVKVALALACIDWAQVNQGFSGPWGEVYPQRPYITLGHWARAQRIAESWRASAHRLLSTLDVSEDAMNEQAIMAYLVRARRGATIYQLTRRTSIRSRQKIKGALEALEESGLVLAERKEPGPDGGRPTVRYFATDKARQETA